MNLKYKEGSSSAHHLNEMHSIVNQLFSMEIVLDDELQALLLLSSFPASWETVISLNNSASDVVVAMSLATRSLLNEERRRKILGSSQSETLVIGNRGRSKSRKLHCREKSR